VSSAGVEPAPLAPFICASVSSMAEVANTCSQNPASPGDAAVSIAAECTTS